MSDLRSELTSIYQRRGVLTPEAVVEEATPVESPLHDHFEWDDSVAGPKYRRIQAETLIRRIKIETAPPSGDEGPHFVRAWVPNRKIDRTSDGYRPTEEVLADPMLRKMLLAEMHRDWMNFQRRYSHMTEFADFIKQQVQEAS